MHNAVSWEYEYECTFSLNGMSLNINVEWSTIYNGPPGDFRLNRFLGVSCATEIYMVYQVVRIVLQVVWYYFD